LTVLGKELVMLFSPLNQWAEEWVEKRDNKKFEKGESQS
jgi:DNA-binding HxlR family transcriptional regulator